jgi:Zn-dependent protease with chaperone function
MRSLALVVALAGVAAAHHPDDDAVVAEHTKTLEASPRDQEALRGRCQALHRLGRREEAIVDCETALEQSRSAENKAALAQVLVDGDYTEAEELRAIRLAGEAWEERPADAAIVGIACDVALRTGMEREFVRCARRLIQMEPDGARAKRYRELLQDEAAPAGSVQSGGGGGGGAGVVAIIAAGWFGGLVVLMILGWMLSFVARAAAKRGPVDASAQRPAELRMVRAYRRVLWLCGVYFFASIPLLMVAVFGVVVLFLAVGKIPVYGAVFVFFLVLMTIWSIVAGLVIRADEEEPGVGFDHRRHPRLHALLDEVARKVGTPPIDTVYLAPGAELEVFEAGGPWKKLRGRTQRCLTLGVALLDGLEVEMLRSLLAHELGHFKNEDTTAGGTFVRAMDEILDQIVVRMRRSGAAGWYNPSWWFLWAFTRVYQRIAWGALRLQEVLADRRAVAAYGSEPFVRGLRHVHTSDVRFGLQVQVSIAENAGRVTNVYAPTAARPPQDVIDRKVEVLLAEETPGDSHPSGAERIAWAKAMNVFTHAGDGTLAWSLFEDREVIERRLTTEIREAVAVNHGVVLVG